MTDRLRVVFVSTHPIQYLAPLFREMAAAEDVDFEVWYGHRARPEEQAGAGFGVKFDWDVDLLGGYRHRFIENEARVPHASTFFGVDNPEVTELLARESPDVIVVNGWHFMTAFRVALAGRGAGIPVLVRSDSTLVTPRRRWVTTLKALTHRVLLRLFWGGLPVGKASQAYLLRYGMSPSRTFVVPHTVDVVGIRARVARAVRERTQIRRELGLPDNAVVFAFVGKLIAVKRPTDFVEALARVHSRGVNVWGLVVGSGPLEPQVRAQAVALGARLRFAGFRNQTEVPRMLAASDVLVLCSESETWGVVVNEALAAGIPCIVSDAVGAAADFVKEGGAVRSYPWGQIDALADQIATLAFDTSSRCAMAAATQAQTEGFAPAECARRLQRAATEAATEARGGRRKTSRP